ncbi:MAG: sensor domain-containing diguanylate cyclase, partial [Candidatus Omnitrophica bacterium]|nr:sensor domain-containing diguanylate cyclase [Candidatus Omnitrophota bacterium]
MNEENVREAKDKSALLEKISRYAQLKNIIEEISHNLSLESIADTLSSIVFSLIGENKGVCSLYLADHQSRTGLSLFKAKKEDRGQVIKSKEGDIFDLWVLRHTSSLLVEDIKKDFRFDLEKIKSDDSRKVLSLVSSPFLVANRFLGILRLDNPEANFYTQDDLRLLLTICDLGALALENGELFSRTQELAIHDELTSLYTKAHFLERLKEETGRAMRGGGQFSLLMFDIDYFKNYNDKFGHTAGDIVLKRLSQCTVEFLKDLNPIICRFGGEEFCALLSRTDKEKADSIAEGLRAEIEKTKIILR